MITNLLTGWRSLLEEFAMTFANIKAVKAEPLVGEARLVEMLTYLRPAGSQTESDWIERFILPVAEKHSHDFWWDAFGNLYVQVGPDEPRRAWCAHTDTVGRTEGRVTVALEGNVVGVPKRRSTCLGADDGAGCAILLEMIEAGVQGLFVFFAEEEVGGRGSSHAATKEAQNFDTLDFIAAFDRRGETSVITHQAGGRCCSDEFAKALADAFNACHGDNMFDPDDSGVFTDTANLTDLVGECTNISVGYSREHGPNETLDLSVWRRVRDAACTIDWAALPIKRKPGEVDEDAWDWRSYTAWGGFGSSSKSKSFSWLEKDADDMVGYESAFGSGIDYTSVNDNLFGPLSAVEAADLTYDDLLVWTMNDPEEAAELLYSLLHRH